MAKRYRELVARFPNSAKERSRLAWLAGRSGRDLHEAFEHATMAVKLDPDDHACLDSLAEVSFRLGDRAKAIELAKRSVEMNPDDPHFRKQLERFQGE